MKKICVIFLLMMAAVGVMAQGKSQVVTDSVASARLGLNRAYTVYLPEGYSPEHHYPILYLLHGKGGVNTDWVVQGKVREVADRLVKSSELQPTVIVMPDGGEDNTPGRFGYFDIEGWPYESFFFEEFMPAIEAKYNAGGSKDSRAIAGLSMGGGGATSYAQRHPDLFGSVYAMSALMDLPDGRELNSPNDRYNASVRANSCINFVKDADDAAKDSLRSVVWFIDCGDDDFLLTRNLDFYEAMRRAGVPAELRVRDGGHDWEYWHTALYTALPFASRNFK